MLCYFLAVRTSHTRRAKPAAKKEENMNQNNQHETSSTGNSLIAMVTNLAVGMPNEEFGLLSRWMNSEANRRRAKVALDLAKGDEIVFINYSDRLTRGVVLKIGTKNALIRTENGGRMYIPLARLEKIGNARFTSESNIPSLSSLASVAPPGIPAPRASEVATVAPRGPGRPRLAAAKAGSKKKTRRKSQAA